MTPTKTLLMDGLWKNNSALVQLLGLCPLLAVTTSVINALGLGLATTLVLMITNTVIAAFRRLIPNEIRIPIFIMIISSVVSAVHLLTQAFIPVLSHSLGIFIPLIATNCIVIGRAEVMASKNKMRHALIDGFAIGLGATFAMMLLGALREILGSGTLFHGAEQLFGADAARFSLTLIETPTPFLLAILPPGAFIGLGLLLAAKKTLDKKIKVQIKTPIHTPSIIKETLTNERKNTPGTLSSPTGE